MKHRQAETRGQERRQRPSSGGWRSGSWLGPSVLFAVLLGNALQAETVADGTTCAAYGPQTRADARRQFEQGLQGGPVVALPGSITTYAGVERPLVITNPAYALGTAAEGRCSEGYVASFRFSDVTGRLAVSDVVPYRLNDPDAAREERAQVYSGAHTVPYGLRGTVHLNDPTATLYRKDGTTPYLDTAGQQIRVGRAYEQAH